MIKFLNEINHMNNIYTPIGNEINLANNMLTRESWEKKKSKKEEKRKPIQRTILR